MIPFSKFGIQVANLPGYLDTALVIDASRCGAGEAPVFGLLNLEATTDSREARMALDRVARLAHAPFSLKLDSSSLFAQELLLALPPNAQKIILSNAGCTALAELARIVLQRGRQLFIEVTDAGQVSLAESLGAHGLVAKGQEGGGFVGEETSFVLLQRIGRQHSLPVWVWGGVGLHSAAACYTGGAAGVILDSQFSLLSGSWMPPRLRASLERASGDETVVLGHELGTLVRVWRKPGMKGVDELEKLEHTLCSRPHAEAQLEWRESVVSRISWKDPETGIWPLGQDSVLAAQFASRFACMGEAIDAIREAIREHVTTAQALAPLARGSALARSHGTEYPILQGPMTRVSDTAEFANAVANGGGLPFLALALLRGPQVRTLLEKTKELAGPKKWGIGILGFVPAELREEQLAVVREIRPPFALIAGGRPDQAASLEKIGIATYLHVPAPSLLRIFVEDGARRFIFEGRECGGHVGPRTSFVLWEGMMDALLEAIAGGVKAEELHIVFAGGVHDAQSSAMVAAMAAPLAAKGVKIGVLMGTAYLFTQEAVEGGAIVPAFQQEALNCRHTVILESGPGHATRCVGTGFAAAFRELKRQLQAEGKAHEEIKDALEALNVGRLRIASKGIDREDEAGEVRYVEVSRERQLQQGMYMIGQIASLRSDVCTIRSLHESVSDGSTEWLRKIAVPEILPVPEPPAEPPCDVAIVGVSCILPKANDVREFWHNVVNKVNGITEVPRTRFDVDRYYDSDKKSRDKIYSRWGGFLEAVAFDPMRYGIPPNALASIDPMQLLALVAVEDALEDAGYAKRSMPRSRTSVILGMSGGLGDVGLNYAVRTTLPEFVADVPESVKTQMPEWTEDTFAGILLNVTAGRVANRFDFGGVNFTVDAACASSLAATAIATRELTARTSDVVIVGGVDTLQSPFGFMCFAKAQALSPRGQCRPFDESADGIAISEGVCMLVLKRLEDAERSGDGIYAVIKGIAGSSDGRGKSMTAPKPEGQIAVLNRAYRQAGFGPATVGLFEAHGTGTAAGDAAEIASLSETLKSDGAHPGSVAVGSVKSMVGHTKAAAGVAGLLKIALALHHKVLPPTMNVEKPNAKLLEAGSPVYANTETRPWIRMKPDIPRRAGVSSFGFGGTNFHAALEEYTGDPRAPEDTASVAQWPAELFLFAGSAETITSAMNAALTATSGSAVPLRQIAWEASTRSLGARSGLRVAIVARSRDELAVKIQSAKDLLAQGKSEHQESTGIYIGPVFSKAPRLAFLFPGQGSQQPDMLRDLAVHFSEFREALESADRVLAGRLPRPLSSYIYPPPVFSAEAKKQQLAAITATEVAQPALGVVELALTRLLARLGITPSMTAGHSYGEYVALAAAGVFNDEALFNLSERRGNAIAESTRGSDAGTMAAVLADAAEVQTALNGTSGITIANYNSPKQTIIAGTRADVEAALEKLTSQKVAAKPIQVACAFHSSLMTPARERLADVLAKQSFETPRAQVFSNTLAAPYPDEPQAMASLLADHLVKPVRFADQIRAMHDAGARVFVEVGPKNVLANLAKQNLQGRDAVILSMDATERNGVEQLLHVLAQLAVLGLPLQADELFRGRVDVAPRSQQTVRDPQWRVTGAGAYAVTNPPEPKHPVLLVDPKTITPEVRTVEVVREKPRELATSQLPSTAAAAGAESIIIEYQRMMQQFLESQTAIMQSYLSGGAPSLSSGKGGPIPIETQTPAEPTPLPVTSSVVAASIPAARVAPAPAPISQPGRDILAELTAIVSERTGYPADMLDAHAAIEADLGIDSIKRVEILSAFQRTCSAGEQTRVQAHMEKLTGARTLGEMADRLRHLFAYQETLAPTPAVAEPKRNILAELTAIVSERTGYPIDMLDANAAIEADLGIDSIKRVEILSAFQRVLIAEEQVRVQGLMEKLTSARTLAELTERLTPVFTSEGNVASAPRFVLRAVPRSRVNPPQHYSGRVVLITDDENGVAASLADIWKQHGERVLLLRHSPGATLHGEGVYSTDLTDPAQIEQLLQTVREAYGPIGALLHLLPLQTRAPFAQLSFRDWQDVVRQDVRSLFLLAKGAENDLKSAGKERGALLVAVTARGGSFGLTPGASISPTHFAVADFVKTLALEFGEVQCKAIDVDPSDPLPILQEKLFDEIGCSDEVVQIGLPGDRRLTVLPQVASLPAKPLVGLTAETVVLLTGGARGITAGIARSLAQLAKPTLILVGVSPLPNAESTETASIADPTQLKAALVKILRAQGKHTVKPADVEAAYSRLLRNREITRNLEELRTLGAMVEYHALDVRDEIAFGSLIDGVYDRFGRLDLVIHGAGVIEDRLLKDKTPESFDRVVHTKTDSSWVLARKLQPEKTRALILMSSITAAFGNRGQADYAAANGTMNGIATLLASEWPGHVVAMNWGPWDQAGMVSDDVRRQFLAQGIQPIPPLEGEEAVLRELTAPEHAAPIAIFGEGPWRHHAVAGPPAEAVLTSSASLALN